VCSSDLERLRYSKERPLNNDSCCYRIIGGEVNVMASKSEKSIVFKDYDILRYPVVTEKSTTMGEYGQYFFIVDQKVTKGEVKAAVERVFDVKVKSVNTMIRKGKLKAFRGRLGLRSDVKKAMVSLEQGYSITFVSGV
jgi:large subunit ribosomal protein L23